MLAKKFNVCPIRTQEIVEQSKTRPDELGTFLRDKWTQLLDDQKKKKKPAPGPSGGQGPAAPSAGRRVRFDVETMTKIFKAKLAENICRFRGFVLDGYPRCVSMCTVWPVSVAARKRFHNPRHLSPWSLLGGA